MEFINQTTGRPRPKAGYRCKICGKEGGAPDSHWYQLCPFKGKATEKRNFNPPRKGYICKFCHKQGGEADSHWFQQCPKRIEYEGVQVPHPLKLRAAATNAGMLSMMTAPQTLAAQTAAVAMNLGVIPTTQPNQIDYTQQFTANGMGIFMYPNNLNNMVSNQQLSQLGQMNQLQQINQQQLYFMQQQLSSQPQSGGVSSSSQGNSGSFVQGTSGGSSRQEGSFRSFDIKEREGIEAFIGQNTGSEKRTLYEDFSNMDKQRFELGMNAFDNKGEESGLSPKEEQLLNVITQKTQELGISEREGNVEADRKAE